MNWRQAAKLSKESFPNAKPTRLGGISAEANGEVILVGYDHPIAIVIYNDTDLARVISTCQAALAKRASISSLET